MHDKSTFPESLNAAFPSAPKDDDHFSPEADAAVSEMTGNTALLAQVRRWARGLGAGPGQEWGWRRRHGLCPRSPLLLSGLWASGSIWASWELTFQCRPSCGSCLGLASSLYREAHGVTFKQACLLVCLFSGDKLQSDWHSSDSALECGWR